MDWRKPAEALIPGLEGVALRQLYAVNAPREADFVYGDNVIATAPTGCAPTRPEAR